MGVGRFDPQVGCAVLGERQNRLESETVSLR